MDENPKAAHELFEKYANTANQEIKTEEHARIIEATLHEYATDLYKLGYWIDVKLRLFRISQEPEGNGFRSLLEIQCELYLIPIPSNYSGTKKPSPLPLDTAVVTTKVFGPLHEGTHTPPTPEFTKDDSDFLKRYGIKPVEGP